MNVMSVHQPVEWQDAQTATLPRRRFESAGGETAERPVLRVDLTDRPVSTVPAPESLPVELTGEQPGAARFGEDYELGEPATWPTPEDAVRAIFEQQGMAVQPMPAGYDVHVVAGEPVEPAARHAVEEVDEPLSPFVEQLLAGEVSCSVCGEPFPCGKGDGGAPAAAGEPDATSGDPDLLVFRDVVDGRAYGSWEENDLTQDLRARLAVVEQRLAVARQLAEERLAVARDEVLARLDAYAVETARLGPARRAELFGPLREEVAALLDEVLVDEAEVVAVAAGPVSDEAVAVATGGLIPGAGSDSDEVPLLLDGCTSGMRAAPLLEEPAGPAEARSGADGAEEDRQVHLDAVAEESAAAGVELSDTDGGVR